MSSVMQKSEKEKMLSGEMYDASDPELVEDRIQARDLLLQYNNTSERNEVERSDILRRLISKGGEGLFLQAPFYCDYGSNITTGKNVYFNFNCTVLDVAPVSIGNNSIFGPGVQILTATHPMNARERESGIEFAKPISIGDNVWVGGGVIINPGVTIGDNSVVGSGSVVTKDVPSNVVVAGNPAKFIRDIPDE